MTRKYDNEYKVQAVKLTKEIGGDKAAKELGIPSRTIHTWLKAAKIGKLDIGERSHTASSGRCHDNARCENMWARMKSELLYDRYNTAKITLEELKGTHLAALYQLLE